MTFSICYCINSAAFLRTHGTSSGPVRYMREYSARFHGIQSARRSSLLSKTILILCTVYLLVRSRTWIFAKTCWIMNRTQLRTMTFLDFILYWLSGIFMFPRDNMRTCARQARIQWTHCLEPAFSDSMYSLLVRSRIPSRPHFSTRMYSTTFFTLIWLSAVFLCWMMWLIDFSSIWLSGISLI